MLRGLGIETVEMCSRLTPHAINVLGDAAQDWKNRAKRYLESAKSGQPPLWRAIESMSKEQRRELGELIDEERQAGWNAPVEQIAEGLELEIDDRATRANRVRQLKNLKLKWPAAK
jgi:endonuclease YncB( thermonuclease family)